MKKPCRNCGRIKTVVAEGCCFVCYNAGKGLTGEAKEKALAEAKRRIDAGEIRKSGPGNNKRSKPDVPFGSTGRPDPGPPPSMGLPPHKFTPPNELMARIGNAPDIPVTIRLTIEIGFRFTGLAA